MPLSKQNKKRYDKRYRELNRERLIWSQRDHRLKKQYGIGMKEYMELFKKQNGLCAICGLPQLTDSNKKYFDVDHDHKTGKVRGLVHGKCNRAIGAFEDERSRIIAALEYLDLHSNVDAIRWAGVC